MDVSANHKFKKILNAWNSGKPDELIKLCTDFVVYEHSGSDYLVIRGKQEFRTYLTELFNSIQKMHHEYINTSWNDQVYFAEWRGSGVLSGKRYGVEGKNTPITYEGVFVFILDPDGKIVERDAYLVAGANRISELEKKKIEIAESAIISGIGGAILNESLMSNVNALALLTMHAMEIPDPDSVLSIIKALNSIYNLKINTAVLEESVKRLHEQINKISEEYKASKGEDADNSMYK